MDRRGATAIGHHPEYPQQENPGDLFPRNQARRPLPHHPAQGQAAAQSQSLSGIPARAATVETHHRYLQRANERLPRGPVRRFAPDVSGISGRDRAQRASEKRRVEDTARRQSLHRSPCRLGHRLPRLLLLVGQASLGCTIRYLIWIFRYSILMLVPLIESTVLNRMSIDPRSLVRASL